MRVSKNRQSGFIKKCTSATNLQPIYKSHYDINPNESFSKFQQEFSSFCYKLPQNESQNQFSLFVFNGNKQEKVLKGVNNKKGHEIQLMKENDFKLSNKTQKNYVIEQNEKILDEEDSEDDEFTAPHIKFNTNNNSNHNRISSNYYSATTTYIKGTNKIGVNQNQNNTKKKNSNFNQSSTQTYQNIPTQYYSIQQGALSPRQNGYQQKQVGKLRKVTSKQKMTTRLPVQFVKKYQEDMHENGEEYYHQKQNQSQRNNPQTLKKIKSDENLFSFKNLYTTQYAHKDYKSYRNNQNSMTNRKIGFVNETHHNNYPTQTNRRKYKQVSESQVVESEPSFLKERLQEIERRKIELLEKKKELQEMKKKSFERELQQSRQIPQKVQNLQIRQRKNQQKDRSELDSQSDPDSVSYEPQIKQKSSSQSSESLDRSESSSLIKQRQSFEIPSSSQVERHLTTQFKQETKMYQPQKSFQRPISPKFTISKSPKGRKFIETKTSPIKIIKQIERRSQRLKQQELKEMYEKQGISVAKGGVTFDINTKDFIYPEKDNENVTVNQPSQKMSSKETLMHRDSHQSNQGKNPKKITSKEELKRRRQLAKSYDRYTRNKLFGLN